jgi:hypothetical protein
MSWNFQDEDFTEEECCENTCCEGEVSLDHISPIIEGILYIGSCKAAADIKLLHTLGITCVNF